MVVAARAAATRVPATIATQAIVGKVDAAQWRCRVTTCIDVPLMHDIARLERAHSRCGFLKEKGVSPRRVARGESDVVSHPHVVARALRVDLRIRLVGRCAVKAGGVMDDIHVGGVQHMDAAAAVVKNAVAGDERPAGVGGVVSVEDDSVAV